MRDAVSPAADRAQELDSRLHIGLSYDEYTDKVGDLKVAYDQVDFDSADADQLDCLTAVGLPAEQALNQYTRAASAWSKCFDDVDCSNDSVKPTWQRHWAQATRKTNAAKDGPGKAQS